MADTDTDFYERISRLYRYQLFFQCKYQTDTDSFSIQNIKPIPIPILEYQAIANAKNQGKVNFLNKILPET